MSNDQRNTLLISGLSIIIGLIVGMFIPRFIDLAHRERERGDAIRLEREFFPQGDRLAYRIFRLIHPDSIQAGKIKEVIDRAVANEWMSANIFSIFSCSYIDPKHDWLTPHCSILVLNC